MTNEEAIHKLEYSKMAYHKLIDEGVDNGRFVGDGVEGEWKSDTPLNKAYNDMIEALDLAIKALEQQPKTGHWEDCSNGWMCSNCDRDVSYESDFCPHCGADMRESEE